jgi:hypothetical protein
MATFYTDLNDTNLKNDLQIKQPDMYIAKHESEGTGTLTRSTSGSDYLTISGLGATPDEYISSTCYNIQIVDDNSKLAYGKITDNTGDKVIFEADNMLLYEDDASAPALTDGTTYSYRILTPSSASDTGNAYGEFLGYGKEIAWAPEQETATFVYGLPEQPVAEDLIRNNHNLNCNMFTTRYNYFKAVFGMTQYGSQTSQSQAHFGSASFSNDYYQLALIGQYRDGRIVKYIYWKVNFKPNGEINFSEEGYKPTPTTFKLFRDTLRDSTSVDFGAYILSDS